MNSDPVLCIHQAILLAELVRLKNHPKSSLRSTVLVTFAGCRLLVAGLGFTSEIGTCTWYLPYVCDESGGNLNLGSRGFPPQASISFCGSPSVAKIELFIYCTVLYCTKLQILQQIMLTLTLTLTFFLLVVVSFFRKNRACDMIS